MLIVRTFIAITTIVLLSACSIRDLVDVDSSSNTSGEVDPELVKTYSGAIGLYNEAIRRATSIAVGYMTYSGVMTDELSSVDGTQSNLGDLDARVEPFTQGKNIYDNVGRARIQIQYAIGALRRFSDQAPKVYLGELYALQGMMELLLAEGFCSGIPLLKTPFGENFQFTRGFTTVEVFQHADALFDTALNYGADSVRIATLARLGKGRALLGLGQISAAAQSVASIEDGSAYLIYYRNQEDVLRAPQDLNLRILNREGGNGLVWVSNSPTTQDPRVPVVLDTIAGVPTFTSPTRQAKYMKGRVNAQVLADWIEARLIQAESQLQPLESPSGPWLATLNTLRAKIGLADTTDPGIGLSSSAAQQARIDLLFRERAFWLYLTGHRQGDLRRLIRQYGRIPEKIYPWGAYPVVSSGIFVYGNRVTIPVPQKEQDDNPLYDGCIDRNP